MKKWLLIFVMIVSLGMTACSSKQESVEEQNFEESSVSLPVEIALEEEKRLGEEKYEITTDLHTYRVTRYQNEDTQEIVSWEVEIYNGDTGLQTISYAHDEYVACLPSWDELIWEADVNFDGVEDLLILQGHYGVQGSLGYQCYLADKESGLYVWCPSFNNISNPAIDNANQMIIGTNRSNAVSYREKFYKYDGEAFVLSQSDFYVYDEASNQHQKIYSLDASVPIYTANDYALAGSYEGKAGLKYSINIYTSGDGIGECVDIGTLYVSENPEYSQKEAYLYKISEGQYCAFCYDDMSAYYLSAKAENDIWLIQVSDREGNIIDILTQTEHYVY